MPRLRRPSRICGTAAAASSRSTVMRTISEPARESAATCSTVDCTSAVSVLVIDCTTIGALPPTATLPTITCVVLCRGSGPATSDGFISGLFMRSRISGFGHLHQGAVQRMRVSRRAEPRPSEIAVFIVNSVTYVTDPAAATAFREAYIGTAIARLKGGCLSIGRHVGLASDAIMQGAKH